ncbi:hemolysin family protein [Aliifodinibius sp. S!AR15-10]|uniref:hemolysin family protein n=1 Tax=Aliifodinibius sp. S!AR15-10 TaxID=2950437 RepID=UPI0028567041|nr:hemolysin family protein [Aliifodinibius sp. S!AR15-10]MDR8390331.1 hemolysin family protein [Aliifodinibius sp. S!AR15-10]
MAIQLLVVVAGLVFSAIFSGSEVAFFSISKQLDVLDESEQSGSADQLIIRMLEKPRRLLATILIGNTFANIITSVLAAVITGSVAVYLGYSELVVYIVEVVALTFTILILSEITPKIIAINNPLKISRRLARFIYVFYWILKPLSKVIAESTISLEERLPKPPNRMSTEDIMTMAEVSEMEGSIRSDEREIIENVIEFGTTSVREIMTSRVNIVAISTEDTLESVLTIIRDKSFSRMPLFENDLDNILGIIYSKDVLPYINSDIERTTINWRTIARKPLFVPATKKLDDLLRVFQQEKTHIAIVVDEYGGTEGLITLDDILEEIVGEISDDYEENDEELFTEFKNGVFIFDARIDLDDMEEIVGCELTTEEDEYETLGGLVYHLTERIPNVGERVYFKGLELTIHSVQNNRVRKLRVRLNPETLKKRTPLKSKD